jgi:hypothetical protein|tara:strand:- start:1180 stop:2226 length:1047 start_codon:yes stop_codon:yes gene_type:complete
MKQIIIPSKEEVEAEIIKAREILEKYGIDNAHPELPVDWTAYFERAQKQLNKSGSRQHSGTLVLTDWYPLNRTLFLDSHVQLKGSVRAGHHLGSSCGFCAEEDFEGDWILSWKQPNKRSFYSNFGAGIRNIHIQSQHGLNGVCFRGAQQSAGVDNLVVRGFGENAVGVKLGGDTYSVRDVFSDAAKGGEDSVAREGAVAFELGSSRVYSLRLENITSHNCGTGLQWGDAHQITIENFETELTTQPLVCTWDARGINIRNGCFRHTKNLLKLEKVRWPSDSRIKIDGMMADNSPGEILLPNGDQVIVPKNFDLVIEGDRTKGLRVVDLKKMRESYLDSISAGVGIGTSA